MKNILSMLEPAYSCMTKEGIDLKHRLQYSHLTTKVIGESKKQNVENMLFNCNTKKGLLCPHIHHLFFPLWGGDPVYPTVNYIQDPNEIIDYRGPDFHEPTPKMLAYLKEAKE